MRRFDALQTALEAIDQAEELNVRQKRVASFIVRVSPLKRIRVIDVITEAAEAEQVVTADGEVAAAVDWMAFLKLILPLILALL